MKKKLILAVALLLGGLSLQAQDCDALLLPLFRYDSARMADYPSLKRDYRCAYARAAFYESDTVPAGARLYNISEVREKFGTNYLPQNLVVDLSTLSYYAYNFEYFQTLELRPTDVVCFSTPSSAHPYLVLRSIVEMGSLAEQYYYQKMQEALEEQQ